MARREPRLERGVEGAGDRYAKGIGWLSRKLNGEGYRSWPDRMYLGPRRAIFFIEYKRDGGEATPLQLMMHELLRLAGFAVYLCDSIAEARSAIDAQTQLAGGRKAMAIFKRRIAAMHARWAKEL